MDLFGGLTAFVTTVEEGAFAKAAQRLGVATSSVTRQVDSLEGYLKAVLLYRSTRQLTLTDLGESYYEQAVRILRDLEEANRTIGEMDGPPQGLLRVSAPVVFAQLHLAPLIPAFLKAFSKIELDINLSDTVVNMVEERIDVAVRIGPLDSTPLIARKLASNRRIVCASPAYLDRHGVPQSPVDLRSHNCLTFSYSRSDRIWRFNSSANDKQSETVRVKGSLRANNSAILRDAVLGGIGIGLLPSWLVESDIASKRLLPLIDRWSANPGLPGQIHAVYPPNLRGSKKVRAFVDFVAAKLGGVTEEN
jgi:DNA-binding transcriptional LysR family regulator